MNPKRQAQGEQRLGNGGAGSVRRGAWWCPAARLAVCTGPGVCTSRARAVTRRGNTSALHPDALGRQQHPGTFSPTLGRTSAPAPSLAGLVVVGLIQQYQGTQLLARSSCWGCRSAGHRARPRGLVVRALQSRLPPHGPADAHFLPLNSPWERSPPTEGRGGKNKRLFVQPSRTINNIPLELPCCWFPFLITTQEAL